MVGLDDEDSEGDPDRTEVGSIVDSASILLVGTGVGRVTEIVGTSVNSLSGIADAPGMAAGSAVNSVSPNDGRPDGTKERVGLLVGIGVSMVRLDGGLERVGMFVGSCVAKPGGSGVTGENVGNSVNEGVCAGGINDGV